jgi:hypothetical protein
MENMQCGQSVSDTCVGKAVPYTDAGFQYFVDQAINVFMGGVNIFLQMGTQNMSVNMMMGVNALRCAVMSGGATAWYFIASAWWALYWLGQEVIIEDALTLLYPYICTCNEDVDKLAEMMGGSSETAAAFGSCSESSSNLSM